MISVRMTAMALTAQIDKGDIPAPQLYRIRKCFAVVQFDQEAKGRIVFLPQGAVIRIVGSSRLPRCFEVAHENRLYSIFRVDLLGPWSTPIGARRIEPRRKRLDRTLMGAAACV
jgi:hypothetical protein